jgi:Domain of unknown function (DUF6285)
MQDRPTAPELLDALAELLLADVREWVPRERRFQVLVAANVCAVVARELRAGREPTRADLGLFRRLAGGYEAPAIPDEGSDAEWRDEAVREAAGLARAIRAGELDDELPAVMVGLREHVRRKLEIARPGYAEPPPAE